MVTRIVVRTLVIVSECYHSKREGHRVRYGEHQRELDVVFLGLGPFRNDRECRNVEQWLASWGGEHIFFLNLDSQKCYFSGPVVTTFLRASLGLLDTHNLKKVRFFKFACPT